MSASRRIFPGFDGNKSSPVGDSQVRKLLQRAGKGLPPGPKDRVEIIYDAWSEDGRLLDRRGDRTEPFTFRLGSGKIPVSLDLSLKSMRPGEKASFLAPVATGSAESRSLIFDIRLLAVWPPLERDSRLRLNPCLAFGAFGDSLCAVKDGKVMLLSAALAPALEKLRGGPARVSELLTSACRPPAEEDRLLTALEALLDASILHLAGRNQGRPIPKKLVSAHVKRRCTQLIRKKVA